MMMKEKVVKISVFVTLLAAFVCAVRLDAQEAVAPPSFRLIGTIGGKDLAGAVLDAGGVQTFFRLHDTAPDGSQIVAVENDSISLKRPDGTRYELFIIHDMIASSPSRPSAGPVSYAPGAADIRPIPLDMQRSVQRQGGPGPAAAAEARERHRDKPGRNAADQDAGTGQQNDAPRPRWNAADQGAGTNQQNSAASPNSSAAAGADQNQRGQRPPGPRRPPGPPVSQ